MSIEMVVGICLGWVAGFLDAIAGGGGLITLPVLSLLVGPGAVAVGTNKIAGTMGLLGALAVYVRKGQIPWKETFFFSIFVALGSGVGSRFTPLVSKELFRWMLLIACPLVLAMVWNRRVWAKVIDSAVPRSPYSWKAAVLGVACGLYDGFFGPGGGTFIFLALIAGCGMPLLAAMGASKVANLASSSTSLASFATMGYVRPQVGLAIGAAFATGSLVGASIATRHAGRIVRPILLIVVSLLLVRVACMR